MANIIMITGGQRSGKSRMAEEKALSLSPTPVSDGGGYQALIGPMDERGVFR